MAPSKTKAEEPAQSAPAEASMKTVEAVVAAASEPEQEIVLPKASVPETPKKKYMRVKLRKNYRPQEIDGVADCVVYDIIDPEKSSPDDVEAPRKRREMMPEERAKLFAGKVIGLQIEEARFVLSKKIAERFDEPNLS